MVRSWNLSKEESLQTLIWENSRRRTGEKREWISCVGHLTILTVA